MPLDELDAALAWRIAPRPASRRDRGQADAARASPMPTCRARSTPPGAPAPAEGRGRGGRFPGRARPRRQAAARARRRASRATCRSASPRARATMCATRCRAASIAPASFRVKGDLWDFPFHSAREGELRIALQVQDVVYAYLPSARPRRAEPASESPWPALTAGQRRARVRPPGDGRCAGCKGAAVGLRAARRAGRHRRPRRRGRC